MGQADELIAAIETIHGAGLDPDQWPAALSAVAGLVGGVGGTLEAIDRPSFTHTLFRFAGIPAANQDKYLAEFAQINPRLPSVMGLPAGAVTWDYQGLDEADIARSPFYGDFLAGMGLRFYVCAVLASTPDSFTAVTVQRTPRQGHADAAGLAMMARLTPHLRQAVDVGERLGRAEAASAQLQDALAWLVDGVAMVGQDGAVIWANQAFLTLARRGDGLRLAGGMVEPVAAEARARLGRALAALEPARAGLPHAPAMDFPLPRHDGAPAYLMAVRLLPRNVRGGESGRAAAAMLFVRDRDQAAAADIALLRAVFGFTEAEASLAQALQTGGSPAAYARSRGVGVNTVYTHLSALRDKTGCTRLPDLIRKLNALALPLRPPPG